MKSVKYVVIGSLVLGAAIILGYIAWGVSSGGTTTSYAKVTINGVPLTGNIKMGEMANTFVAPDDCEDAECSSLCFDGRLQAKFVLTGGKKAEDVLMSGKISDVQRLGNDQLLINKENVDFVWLDGITIGTCKKMVEVIAGEGKCLNSSDGASYVYEDSAVTVIICYSDALCVKTIELYFK